MAENQMSDLLQKLRARVQRNHVAGDKWAVIPDPLCQAAADEIERLLEIEGWYEAARSAAEDRRWCG